MRKPFASIALLAFLASSATADVTYEEQTTMSGMMQMFGMGKPTKSMTRVSGDFLRTDNGDEATIIDLAGEKILNLDLKKKTYSVMTFAEMKQQMEQAMAQLQGKQAEKPQQQPSAATMKTEVRVTDTGRSETIQGASCKQYLLEMDLTAKSEKEQKSGTMSTLTEMWMAKDVPGLAEVNAFYRKMAEKAGSFGVNQQWAAAAAQLVYLFLFSYAFFFEGFTGLTVTVGAVLTLFVLMQLTARVDWEKALTRGYDPVTTAAAPRARP